MKVCLATRYNSEIENYHIYVTNIQKEILDSKAIVKLYEVRWDIEVLFKDFEKQIPTSCYLILRMSRRLQIRQETLPSQSAPIAM